MARDRSILLSNLTGGLNRFQQEAGRNQYIDGLNVTVKDGDAGRRPAFVPVGSGAPHYLPAGAAQIKTAYDTDGVQTFLTVTTPAVDALDLTDQEYLYVGSRAPGSAPWGLFSGIDVRHVASSISPTKHYKAQPQYYSSEAGAFVNVPSFVDETRDVVDGYIVPFARDGRIYWHLAQFAGDWAASTVDGVNAKWIRIAIQRLTDGELEALNGGTIIRAPGIRLFNLAPVNGLFSLRVNNRSSLIVGSDQENRLVVPPTATSVRDAGRTFESGLALGAQLGAKTENMLETKTLYLLEDEGPAVYGVQNWPRPKENGVNVGTAQTFGTTNRMKKTREKLPNARTNRMDPYEWLDHQFRGGLLSEGLELPGGGGGNVNSLSPSTASAARLQAISGWYRHCRLRCTARVSGGPQINEEREVWDHVYSGGTHTFYVYPAWSSAPSGDNEFQLFAPHSVCAFEGQRPVYEVVDNEEHLLEFNADDAYAPDPADISPTNPLYFRVGRELRFLADAGEVWSGVTDPVSGLFICTNGRAPIMEYDGRFMRRLRADQTSRAALAIAGQTPSTAGTDQDQRQIAKSTLYAFPPAARFLAIHRQRVFAVGPEPLQVRWSEVGGNNQIWPRINTDIVRDSEQDPIRGMLSFNDRLILWTPTAIHEAIDISVAPFFSLQQVSRSIGFVGPHSVCVVIGRGGASELVGVTPDGIAGYSSGEPRVILDDFARVIENGVNTDMLHRAVAVYAPQSAKALFAVPPRGSSSNTRIIEWDVHGGPMHVWSCPFGVRSMAVDNDELGRERILFGTDDGYVMTLGDRETDDGSEIESFALTPFVSSKDGNEYSLVGALVEARSIGRDSSKRMGLDLHVDGNRKQPIHDSLVSADTGGPNFPTAAPEDGVVPQEKDFSTFEIRAVSYARGHSFAYRVSGSCRWWIRSCKVRTVQLAPKGRL